MTNEEKLLAVINHFLSMEVLDGRFESVGEACAYYDNSLAPIDPKTIPEWAREAYTIAVDHKGD